jgi:CRP/FNR family transcriptional regulator, cyclic AMP receptor protein
MFFLGEIPQPVLPLVERFQTLSQRLLTGLEFSEALLDLPANSQPYEHLGNEYLGVVTDGIITVSSLGVDVFCLEAGDLVGLNRVFGLPHGELRADAQVQIQPIHRDTFIQFMYAEQTRQHRWSNYLLTISALYGQILNHVYVSSLVQPPKGFRQFAAGDVIVHEGELADDVLQLMSGHADVYVQDTKVGEIPEGEIFGAMAVFTEQKRTATVRAREHCTVLTIPKNQFVNLIRAKPETCLTLLENMSRCIKDLNGRISQQEQVDLTVSLQS